MEEKEVLEQRLSLCDKYMSNALTSKDYRELMKVLGVGSIPEVTTDAILEIKERIQDEYDIVQTLAKKVKKETPKKTTTGGRK